MSEYNFTVLVQLRSARESGEQHLEALLEGGCDDATIAFGRKGYLHLDFGREAESTAQAVRSAISDVERVVPGARVVALGPDLVGTTELADLFGCTRQNMRLYATSESKVDSPFPPPAADGSPLTWHLAEVAKWLEGNTPLRLSDPLLHEVAEATFVGNHSLQAARIHADATWRRAEALLQMGGRTNVHTGRRVDPRRVGEAVARLAGTGTVKTKLNKLMFYADFGHFRAFGASITGLPYARLPLGPVPDDYRELFAELEGAGFVTSAEEIRGGYAGEVIRPADVGPGVLNPDEVATIEAVRRTFDAMDATTIVNVSHEEPAWLETEHGRIIPYTFAERLVALPRA